MSGHPNIHVSDADKFRAEYMANLALQIELNENNLEANRNYLATGQLPAVSQMVDNRSTSELLADSEKLKMGLVADLKSIGNTHFALSIIQTIERSPLNTSGSLLTFFAQRAPEIVLNLKKQYKYGIKGDENDVRQFVNFVEDMYNKTKTFSNSVKSYFNSSNDGFSNGIIRLGDLSRMKEALTKISRNLLLKMRNPGERGVLDRKIVEISRDIHILEDFLSYEDFITNTELFIESQTRYEGNREFDNLIDRIFKAYKEHNTIMEDLPKKDTLFSLLEQLEQSYKNSNPSLSFKILDSIHSQVLPFHDLENINREIESLMTEYQRFLASNEFHDPENQINDNNNGDDGGNDDDFYDARGPPQNPNRNGLPRLNGNQGQPPPQGPPDDDGNMPPPPPRRGLPRLNESAPIDRLNFVGDLPPSQIPSLDGIHRIIQEPPMTGRAEARERVTEEARQRAIEEYNTRRTSRRIEQQRAEADREDAEREMGLMEREEARQRAQPEPQQNQERAEERVIESNQPQNFKSIIDGIINIQEKICNMKNQTEDFKMEESKSNNLVREFESLYKKYKPNSEEEQEENKSIMIMLSNKEKTLDEKIKKLTENIVLHRNTNLELQDKIDKGVKEKELKKIKELQEKSIKEKRRLMNIREKYENYKGTIANLQNDFEDILSRKIKKSKGRPKGSGLTPHKTYKEIVKSKTDLNGGIEQSPRFVKFGKYLINTQKLNNDNTLALKHITGGNIVGIPSTRISSNMQHVIKKMIGGGIPSFSELSKLSEPEKAYLHKISSKSNIVDKFSIPAPDKDKQEKDIHEFEVMKGEIMAGNDSKELIKKFKLHLVKLSRSELLPKKEVQEIMEELINLGY